MLALTAHDQSDHPAAVCRAEEAVAAGRPARDPWSLGLALTAARAARLGALEFDGAEAALAESLAVWTDLGA